jgi:hypothetical protein
MSRKLFNIDLELENLDDGVRSSMAAGRED